MQKEQLIKQNLQTNEAYALKVAAATNGFIKAAQQQLAISASFIEKNLDNPSLIATEINRLHRQTDSFNAVIVINAERRVLAVSPENNNITGKLLSTKGVFQALEAKKPTISTPFTSVLGNLVTTISHPLFGPSGQYLGYIGGTIYLNDKSILNYLLGRHFYNNGSYIYVTDKNQQLIYHPDPNRVGTYPIGKIVVQATLAKNSGTTQAKKSLGIDMLAGFAPIDSTQWRVVAQRPKSETLAELNLLMQKVVFRMLPLALFTFVIIWIVANYISRPLRRLADRAKSLNNPTALNELSKTRAWYFESNQLKQAMLMGLNLLNEQINQLKQDAATDPLTGAFR